MNLQEARQKIPALQGMDDQSTFEVIHQVYYPTWDRSELAQQLNYTLPKPKAGLLRTAGDVGIKLAQGGVDLGAAVVGLGSLATGGAFGKGMRAIGYDPQRTNDALGEYLSASQQAADAKVQQADGFVETIATSIENPRSIMGSIAQSAPGMLAGMGVTGAVARRLATKAALTTAEGAAASAAELAAGKSAFDAGRAALATQTGKLAASDAVEAAGTRLIGLSAATEGAQAAGKIADDAQAAGRNYGDYALPALAAGTVTSAIGLGAGKLMGDSATQLATGARSAGVKGNLAQRIGLEALNEGVLEEMSQSAQEQYFANIAQGEQDRLKGVANAAGTGLVTGGVMGAGMGALQRHVPETGPLARAANAGNTANAALHGNEIAYQATPIPPAPVKSGLSLQEDDGQSLPFDPQPDMRGALHRQPASTMHDASQALPPAYENGIPFRPFATSELAQLALEQQQLSATHEVVPQAAQDGGGFVIAPKGTHTPSLDNTLPWPANELAPESPSESANAHHYDNGIEFEPAPEMQQLVQRQSATPMHDDAQALSHSYDNGIAFRPFKTRELANAALARQQLTSTHEVVQQAAHEGGGFVFARKEANQQGNVLDDANSLPYERFAPAVADNDSKPELSLVEDEEEGSNAIAFDPMPDMRGAHKKAAPRPSGRKSAYPVYENGVPFKTYPTRAYANAALRGQKLTDTHEVVQQAPQDGGQFVFRRKTPAAARPAPQTLDEAQRIADDNILRWSEKTAPLSLRHAQALVAEGTKRGHDFYVVPHVAGGGYLVLPKHWLSPNDQQEYGPLRVPTPGSFSQINELAELAQAEKQDVQHQRQSIASERQRAQQAAVEQQETQQREAFNAAVHDTDTRVQGAQVLQMQARRMAVLDALLAHDEAPSKTAAQLKRAFFRQLQRAGFTQLEPLPLELAKIDRFVALNEALPHQIPSEPNELVDVVPERIAPVQPKDDVNFKAVDDAIAAGLRLRVAGGNVLHKKGSSKIFRLNAAQKEYYLQKMQESTPQQQMQQAAPAMPIAQEADAEAVAGEMSPAQSLQAAHIEAGQAEPASVPVIARSLAKSAAHTPLDLRQARNDLLGRIDHAMTSALDDQTFAPLKAAYDQARTAMQEAEKKKPNVGKEYLDNLVVADQRLRHARAAIPTLTFDIPGDGKFTVVNSRANLARFRQRVANSPGFSERAASSAQTTHPNDRDNKLQALRHMLAEGDLANAYHFAELIKHPLRFGKGEKGIGVPYAETSEVSLTHGLQGFVGREVASYGKHISSWYVIELHSGMHIGQQSKNRQAAIDSAEQSLQRFSAEQVTRRVAELPAMDEAALAAAWRLANNIDQADQTDSTTPVSAASLPQAPHAEPVTESVSASAANPAPPASKQPLTRIELNRKTVKDMSNDELLQARTMFANEQRAPKIEKEIKLRGLSPLGQHSPAELTSAEQAVLSSMGTLDERIVQIESNLSNLQQKQEQAKAVGNAWVYDNEIAAQQKGLAAYREARQRLDEANLPTQAVESEPVTNAQLPQKTATIADNPTSTENQDEHRHTEFDSTGSTPLENMATEQSSGFEGERGTRASATRRGSIGASTSAAPDAETTLPRTRSAGSRAESIHSADTRAAGRERRIGDGNSGQRSGILGTRQRNKENGSQVAGGGRGRRVPNTAGNHAEVPGTGLDVREQTDSVDAPLVSSASSTPALNFRITSDVRLGQGGEVGKFQDNIQAIRSLQAIERENRRATPDEQYMLARYVGWGGLANAFPSPESGEFKPAWQARGQELAQLLTPKEYAQARRSTLDAHYTSQTVVQAMWQAARHLGFNGGLVLESSLGSGNFVGLLPESLQGRTRFIGIELDSITARLATLLYPQETVLHSGLEKVPLPDNAFDLAIGNPPFGEQSLRFQFKPHFNGQSIHNQFFLAALDAVKPGGLLVQVVSRYLMDKQDTSARKMLSKKARLLGAIRLPDSAFKENARTEVVTDIVFLQRLTAQEQRELDEAYEVTRDIKKMDALSQEERDAMWQRIPDWINTTTVADPLRGAPIVVNQYFADHPEMIMGVLERSGSMQYRNDVTVRLDQEQDLQALLQQALQSLPQGVMVQEQGAKEAAIEAAMTRHKTMSDSLQIVLNGWENGALRLTKEGGLEQIVERETPEGGYELSTRKVLPESPWSEHLFQNADGQWTMLEVARDVNGKSLKQEIDGKISRRNLTTRQVFSDPTTIPASMLLGNARFERLRKMVALRDALVAQINHETQDAAEAMMEDNRTRLRAAYHAFIKRHGLINDPANAALVANMPDGALILALEFNYRPAVSKLNAKNKGDVARPSSAKTAPILSRRVISPYVAPEHAASMADALSITLAEMGRVDMARIAQLLKKDKTELEQELRAEEAPLVFFDPESSTWETRDVYLSGQVKRKLNAARAVNLLGNIRALEAVQPESWTADQVTALLGSTWIPASVYQDFIRHITGNGAKVSFSALTNLFHVNAQGAAVKEKADEWGTERRSPLELIIAVLNNSTIRVTYRDSEGKSHFDSEATQLALLKARAISSEFQDWVFRDSERRDTLVELFNEKFNTRVTRQYDGSHLILPGKVPDAIIAMRRHQKNAIWRGVFERNLLLDHAVGAGKTFTAIAIAMERRRMGLSKKPLIVVPNHMVEQFTADAYRLYPGAKILAAGKKDFERSRRRRLFAKIATGEFDIIIVPHSSFGFIDIAQETQERYLEEQLKHALAAVAEAQEVAEEEAAASGKTLFRKPYTVKEAERLVAKITSNLEKIKMPKDKLLTFEQMGIDYMVIDEAHEFKNLFYSSRLTGVKGMGNKSGSQKALDLYNKVRVLRESPTGAVTFMTGTPISNSAVEMYTMMRYLAAKDLAELNLEHFDAWRAQFVSADMGWEPTETGRLQEVTRLGRTWSNTRSLMDLYYSFTDAVDNEAIKIAYAEDNNGAQFPIPPVKSGERQSIVMQPTPAQMTLLTNIMQGFDDLPGIKDPYDRNKERLRLMDKARKVSLDVRVIDPQSDSLEAGGKLDLVAQNVHRLYQQWDADKGTQLIFLDRSVPKARGDDQLLKDYDALLLEQQRALMADDEDAVRRVNEKLESFDSNEMESLRSAQQGGWNAYQQIKNNLVALGIPANEIRFVQEANNDEQKKTLFDAVNEGEVRVLIGSTPRMGAGTNVQQRLVGLHHVDVTWKPSDIEQREGRIIRQGNHLLEKYGFDAFAVEILAYATERTIDAKMWALNAAKLKTINGIRKYDGSFVMEFEDEESVSMAELAALASGDPLLLERVKLTSEIDKLGLLKRQFNRRMNGIKEQLDKARNNVNYLPARIEQAMLEREMLVARFAELEQEVKARQVVIDGTSYSEHGAAQKAVKASIERQQAGVAGSTEEAKFTVQIGKRRLTSVKGALDAVTDALGDFEPFAMQYEGKTYFSRLDAGRDLAKPISDAAAALAKGEADTIALGSILGLPLEASIERSGWGTYQTYLAVVHPDGSTLVSARTGQREEPIYSSSVIRDALYDLGNRLIEARGLQRIEHMQASLQRAQQDLPGLLEKGQLAFPQQAELDDKQQRLDDVVKALSGHKVVMAPVEPVAQDMSEQVQEQAQQSGKDGTAMPSKQVKASNTHSLSSLQSALQQALRPYGKHFAESLQATGKVKLITQAQAALLLNSTANAELAPVAFFYPQHNTSYLIADTIPSRASESALRGLVLHEVANHALHLGKTAPEFTQLLRQFGMMRKTNPKVQAAYDQAIAAGSSAASLSEEALGYYLEANPDLSFVQKVAAWFRAAMRALGKVLPLMQRARWFAAIDRIQPADLIYAAQQALKAAPATLEQTTVDGDFSLAFSKQAVERLLVSVWKNIASAQDAYQYPVSHAKELPQIARTILPEMRVQSMDQSHPKARSTASRQWLVTMPDGKQAYVYEFGRDLQLDASQLQSGGSRGSALYAAIANYAYNTGKVLEGDSAGLSLLGQMRRLENMLSTALKFGTTAHIRPHPEQKNPSHALAPAMGLHGISWSTGDDAHNLAQMLQASYDVIHSLIPEIAHVHLTEFSDFIGADGDLCTDDAFKQLAERATRVLHQRMAASGIATTAQIGSKTLKRAAITGTLLRGEGNAAGRALLGRLGGELHANIGQAQGVLYSKDLSQLLSNNVNKLKEVQLPAGYLLGDLFHQADQEDGKLSWWHKSIGTMDNLAKRYPAFTPVYLSVQRFLGDVSSLATVAADLAPTLLPKLENFADILGSARKHPLTAEDVKAISAPIFEGTLLWARDESGIATKIAELEDRAKNLTTQDKANKLLQQGVIAPKQNKVWAKLGAEKYAALINEKFDQSQLKPGIVWFDEELRTLFGLNAAQIGMYREFRAAIDKSLTNLTLTEMLRLGGKDSKILQSQVMSSQNLLDAANLFKEHFQQLIKQQPDNALQYMASLQHIMKAASKGMELIMYGYAPLSRFGQFTVYVQEDGEQAYFGMFETRVEAAKMARRMREAYPKAQVTQGTISEDAYKLFAGISPETIELFGKMAGLDKQLGEQGQEVYQTYLKLSKSNRSAMKRLIHRSGIAGFHEDAGRVLANFIYSNARLSAANLHIGELDEAITEIPKQQGQLMDAAMQLREHITNPQSGGTMLSGLMFAQYLGGSVASALVNMTQPLTMTLPFLSQYGGVAKAGKRLFAAMQLAAKDSTGDDNLNAALKWATNKGIVAPQEVHYLRAQAAGKGALQSGDGTWLGDNRARFNNALAKLMVGWGKPFAMAELINRRVTFIAAYRTAQEEGIQHPASFAQEAVSQTQGVYNSGNKPRWARNPVGGLAMTFKQYAIAYVELLSRMAFAGQPGSPERAAGQRGALTMLAVLFLLSGADGLPFEKDIEDAIDGLLQRMGYNFSSKRAKQAFLTDVLGEGGADFVLKGVSSLPGMPIDVSGRLGMGNLIPATGLLTKKASYTADLGELAGPAGDMAKRSFNAAGKILGGDVVDAMFEIAPLSVRNARQGVDMLATGEYHDVRGYKINEATPVEAIMKFVGFQPESTAKIQDAKGQALNMISQTRMRSTEIQEHWAQGILQQDQGMINQARAMRDEWNSKNPETPIKTDMPGIVRRVRAMREDALARTQKTAPQALKQSVKRELVEVQQ